MNSLRKTTWALAWGLTALTGAAFAQQPNPAGRGPGDEAAAVNEAHDSAAISTSHMSQQLTPDAFVNKAAQAGMTEVQLGQLALRKSTNPEIRKFAQRMVDDHSKAGAELASIARSSNLKVPTRLDGAHAETVQAMSDKSDADFDTAYVKDMMEDHKQAMALFQQGTSLPDAKLAQFATRTLPTLEEHKRLADGLRSSARVATSQ